MQAFYYETTFRTVYQVLGGIDEDWANIFSSVCLWVVQLYEWVLALLSLLYLGDMLEWICRGCKWKTTETE